MKSFRLIALVLLVLSLALAFASCGKKSNGGPVTDGSVSDDALNTTVKTNPEYSVTYHVNDGRTGAIRKQTEKQLVTYFPERDGYEFGGWYCDSDLFLPWDPAEKADSDLVLYAEWIELPAIDGQLAAPKLTVKDNVFSWEPVSGANGYRVRVYCQGFSENYLWEEIVSDTTWTFPEEREAEIYMVRICAHGNGIDTIDSVYRTRQFVLRVLSDSYNITLDRATSILSWAAVENAEHYEVYIDGRRVCSQSETEYNMSSYDANQYTVTVRAYKPNWKTSSKEVTVSKQTLRVPNVILSVNPDEKSYIVEWDKVLHATDYILSFEGKEVRVKENYYSFDNDSNVWGDRQTVLFTVNSFSDSGEYYMSSGGPTFTAQKLYTLTVENGTTNALDVELRGMFWAPVTVSFDLNGASGSVASQQLSKTNPLTYPELPEREGYIFRGWFTEPECFNVFDFTDTLEQDITLYAGWYKIPSNGTFVEQGTGKTIFESTSYYHYIYFRSLSGHSLTINYQQDTQSPTSYMYFYDVTADQPIGNDGDNEWSFRNPVPAQTSLFVQPGHVYYVRTHSSANTTLRFAFYEYGTIDFFPNDGGKAISDYVLHSTSKQMSNTVIYGETYSVANLSQIGYSAVGLFDGKSNSIQNIVIPSNDCTFTIQGFVVSPEMACFDFESTETTCTITGVKDKRLSSIIIPEYVTNIEEGAFSGCSSLVDITLPFIGNHISVSESNDNQYPLGYIFGSNSYVGGSKISQPTSSSSSSFYYIPSSLRSVTVLNGNIPQGAFMGCSMLESVTIPNGVTKIENDTFRSCSGLTSFTIPDGVTSIGDRAFYSCSALNSITIPDSVTSIGDGAFSSLTTATIPVNVSKIGVYAFSSATHVVWNAVNCTYVGVRDFNGPFGNNLRSVIVGNGVKTIPAKAFYNCSRLSSITIPDSIITIGVDAFTGCNDLQFVEYNNLEYLGNLSNPYVVLIKAKDRSLPAYSISNQTRVINNGAFETCSNLVEMVIPDSVISIGEMAFNNCSKLKRMTVGYGVLSIGKGAFKGCSELTSFAGKGIKAIDDEMFAGFSKLESITLDTGITRIGKRAFSGCTALTSITIPDSVESIGDYAFSGCSGLTTITILDGVISIGTYAFSDCTKLKSIHLPESVQVVGVGIVSGCISLSDLSIPFASVFHSGLYGYTFLPFRSLFFTEGGKESSAIWFRYDSNGYVENLQSQRSIILGETNIKTVTILEGTQVIAGGFFADCSSLASVTIPHSVTFIEGGAFRNCTGLESIIIPDSVTRIGADAFSGCSGLRSITIPDSVVSIGDDAFKECIGLQFNEYDNVYYLGNETNPYLVLVKAKNTSIASCSISTKTKIICDKAFLNCAALSNITIPDGIIYIGTDAFRGCNNLRFNEYDNAYYLGNNSNPFVALIKAKNTSIKACIISNRTKIIYHLAFYKCEALQTISIPNGVAQIGAGAFRWCDHLKTEIYIPRSVHIVGYGAFEGCSSLRGLVFEREDGWRYDKARDIKINIAGWQGINSNWVGTYGSAIYTT